MTTAGRLLELLTLLQTRRDWAGDELADRLEVTTRTVRRDIDRLRELGYPVDAVPGPAGGYRLRAGSAMPPLLLDDEEAVAIAIGLRTAAGTSVSGIEETAVRALVKLEQVLPSHLRRRVQALGAATATLTPGGPTVDPQALTILAGACRDGERVRFAYTGRDGTATRRLVEPCGLVNLGRRWYLVAWCTQREDWRTFRLDRVESPAATGIRSTGRPPPATDLAAHVAARLRDVPYRHRARVRVHAPADAVRPRLGHVGGRVEPIDATTCEFRSSDDQLDWLAVRIGMLGFEVDVLEPPELVEAVGRLGARLVRAGGG